jgi:hypothetical protein
MSYTKSTAILSLVASSTNPIGVSHRDMVEGLGIDTKNLTRSICRLGDALHHYGRPRDRRYFASAHARDAAIPLILEHWAAAKRAKAERKRETDRIRWEQRRGEENPIRRQAYKPKKPAQADKPKPAAKPSKPANVTVKERNRAWWPADAEPVITAATRVTIAPPPVRHLRTNTHSPFGG